MVASAADHHEGTLRELRSGVISGDYCFVIGVGIVVGHPEPDDLTGINLAIHIGGVEDIAGKGIAGAYGEVAGKRPVCFGWFDALQTQPRIQHVETFVERTRMIAAE